MIIPVCCQTCGKVIADKWEQYEREVRSIKEENGIPLERNTQLQGSNVDKSKTPECEVLDKLGLTRQCCRRMLLAHLDLHKEI